MAVRWSGSRNPVEKPIEVSHQPTRLTKQVSKGTATRVRQMGPWNQQATSRQLAGPSSLPMPVEISEQTTLRPIFRDLESNGDVFPLRKEEAALARNEISLSQAQEAYYNVPFIEYEKGVIHADRRLDLCKMVLGPPNIENLLDSLDKNTFIKHVLLGNNIIGPKGARRVAKFIHDHPDQMETWYLAGNCINSEGFYDIVNGLLKSIASNLWLKRNPLTIDAVKDIARLISQSQNLQTLDLDQTGLTDAGVARLFDLLIASGEQQHVLKHLYLNGNGIGVQGATSIAGYLSSPSCSLKSLYLSNNPLGDAGVSILGRNIMLDSPMERLMISSVGMTSLGASKLLNSLAGHKNLLALDIGQSFATDDLGTRYNWITDDAFPSIRGYIRSTTSIRYLDFGVTAISFACINDILPIIADHNGLCWVGLDTIEFGRKKRDILLAGKLRQSISASLARNVLILYNGIEYKEFELGHKRSLTGPEEYVRKIDSVYRNRDAMLARRGLKPLDKWWDEKDPTIQTVMEWR